MDPSLLRERELFKKRALSTPAVEKRPAPSSDSSSKKKKAKVEQGGSSSSKQNAGWWKSSVSQLFGVFYHLSLSYGLLVWISLSEFCWWLLSLFFLNCCFLLRNSLVQWEKTVLLPRMHVRPHPVTCLLLVNWSNHCCQNIILDEAELWFVGFSGCWP